MDDWNWGGFWIGFLIVFTLTGGPFILLGIIYNFIALLGISSGEKTGKGK